MTLVDANDLIEILKENDYLSNHRPLNFWLHQISACPGITTLQQTVASLCTKSAGGGKMTGNTEIIGPPFPHAKAGKSYTVHKGNWEQCFGYSRSLYAVAQVSYRAHCLAAGTDTSSMCLKIVHLSRCITLDPTHSLQISP
jgi:hypothetical protein